MELRQYQKDAIEAFRKRMTEPSATAPLFVSPHRRHIDTFIFKGAEYFTANLVGGGVRVGLIGSNCFDFPESHEFAALARQAKTFDEVEALHDAFCGYYL